MTSTSKPVPHARACDSCGDLLQPKRIYIGHIASMPMYVCEPCAAWHSNEQFTLYTIAQARLTIRQAHARLNTAAGVR